MAQPKKAARMSKNDQPLVSLGDIPLALGLLTRLPVPITDTSRSAHAAWAYPLAGLVAAGLAALAGLVASSFGTPAPLSALISLAVLIVTTGAMHEDGLADTADGLWGGWNRDRRLEIMKDSHIGTYGVIALLLSLGARWSALTLLFQMDSAVFGLLAAALLSRASMPVLMASLPHARHTGLSHSVGQVGRPTAAIAAIVACFLCIFLIGSQIIGAVIATLLVTVTMGLIAQRKIQGQTGDILGATQQLAEIAVLFSLLT